jgi:hypothetical protein
MMQVKKAIAFGRSMLLLALMAACADQSSTPLAPVDAARAVAPEVGVANYDPVVVFVSGPPKVITTGTYMWQTYATGGDGTYSYVWERRTQGSSTWTYVGSGTIYYGSVGYEPSFELRVTAYSGGLAGSQTYAVEVAFLSASISGPSSINAGTSGTWTGSSTGGFDYKIYEWYHRPASSGTWTYVGGGTSYTRYVSTSSASFYLRLKVSSGQASTTTDHYVQVIGGGSGGGGEGGGGGCQTCPVINGGGGEVERGRP